jgi:putative ribosome biogenesis GTPase RsgA
MKFNKNDFVMVYSEENTENGFEDIKELSTQCKFSNCTHTGEPNCAVQKSISEGTLPKERFTAYYREKNEAEHVANQKNKTKAVDYMKQRKLFQKPGLKSKE